MTTGPTTELRAEDAGLALGTAPGRLALTATVAASGMASLDATVVQQPLHTSALSDVMVTPAWKSLPSWYAVALNDEAIETAVRGVA